ncbi:MAG: DUF4168 domain-containing protein [Phormidesmis sp. CAN_BIN44]|nr:DUF4168 domain-containing protein [Phormidesmis sp. CAN_BIN44]
MKRVLVACCTAVLVGAAYLPAQAQAPAPAPQVAPTPVSKEEVQKFASAIEQILVINRASETEAMQAIKAEGLTEQRFDEIYKSQRDPKATPTAQIQPKERQGYDRVVTKLVQIQKDSDAKMEKAVQAQGLEVPRFNQIFEAAQKNPQLRQEIQTLVQQK